MAERCHELHLSADSEYSQTYVGIRTLAEEGDAVPTDVCKAEDAKRLVDITVATHGRLDLAFNNAGHPATGFTADVQEAEVKLQARS